MLAKLRASSLYILGLCTVFLIVVWYSFTMPRSELGTVEEAFVELRPMYNDWNDTDSEQRRYEGIPKPKATFVGHLPFLMVPLPTLSSS